MGVAKGLGEWLPKEGALQGVREPGFVLGVVLGVLAEGDKVVIRCTHSGVHTGDFFGVPATGRNFAYQQMHIIRVIQGKGVEHWAVRDDASLVRQLTA